MKIEVDQKWYDVFLSVLHEVGINDLANDLKAACTKEEASVLHPVHVQRSSPVRCSPRNSGRRPAYADSEDSTCVTGDETLPLHPQTVTQNSVQNRETSPAIVYSTPGNFSIPPGSS